MLFLPAINVKMIVSSGFFGLVDSILPLSLKNYALLSILAFGLIGVVWLQTVCVCVCVGGGQQC